MSGTYKDTGHLPLNYGTYTGHVPDIMHTTRNLSSPKIAIQVNKIVLILVIHPSP